MLLRLILFIALSCSTSTSRIQGIRGVTDGTCLRFIWRVLWRVLDSSTVVPLDVFDSFDSSIFRFRSTWYRTVEIQAGVLQRSWYYRRTARQFLSIFTSQTGFGANCNSSINLLFSNMANEDTQQDNEQDKISAWKKKRQERKQQSKREEEETSFFDDNIREDDENEFVPLSKRRRLEDELLKGSRRRFRQKLGDETTDEPGEEKQERRNGEENQNHELQVESLLESAAALQKSLTEEQRAEKQQKEEEERIMREASKVQT
jgi:hypothetical protein